MVYEDAIEQMKQGKAMQRGGKTFRILPARGVCDVTNPAAPVRAPMTESDRQASDWTAVAS